MLLTYSFLKTKRNENIWIAQFPLCPDVFQFRSASSFDTDGLMSPLWLTVILFPRGLVVHRSKRLRKVRGNKHLRSTTLPSNGQCDYEAREPFELLPSD